MRSAHRQWTRGILSMCYSSMWFLKLLPCVFWASCAGSELAVVLACWERGYCCRPCAHRSHRVHLLQRGFNVDKKDVHDLLAHMRQLEKNALGSLTLGSPGLGKAIEAERLTASKQSAAELCASESVTIIAAGENLPSLLSLLGQLTHLERLKLLDVRFTRATMTALAAALGQMTQLQVRCLVDCHRHASCSTAGQFCMFMLCRTATFMPL